MTEKRTDINSLKEFGLIQHLTKQNKSRNKSTLKSIGDDAAIISLNNNELNVVSTDLLVENIHFDLMYHPLKHLGYKSIVVNLSDIYAMNAIPEQVTFSMALSNRFSVEALEELYEGIYAACDYYNVDLIGGDTSSSNQGLLLSVTALGKSIKEKVVYRNGAKKGDLVVVSGDLGGAYLGLQLLEREKQVFIDTPDVQPDLEGNDYVVGRQLKPEARKDVISLFENYKVQPSSMIDISDGLSSDLRHICSESKVGCQIFEESLPIHPESEQLAFKFKLDPTMCALNGGEDYELLFTMNEKQFEAINGLPGLTVIGEITENKEGVMLHTKGGNVTEMVAQGWNAFSDKN